MTSSNLTSSTFGTTTSEPRRRFSNLSNLAQSLPSTMSSTSGFPVAGSLDLNIIGDQHSSYTGGLGMSSTSSHQQQQHHGVKGGQVSSRKHGGKRGGSHRQHSGADNADNQGGGGVRRTRSALETSCLTSSTGGGGSSRRQSPMKQMKQQQLAVKKQQQHKQYHQQQQAQPELVPAECDSQDSEDGGELPSFIYLISVDLLEHYVLNYNS